MPLLHIQRLQINHLAPIDLEIQAGECITLTGPSGSGKTLLLRAIADLDPHQGEISFNGIDQSQTPAPEWRCSVGYLPAESHWWADEVGAHFQNQDQALLAALGFKPDCMTWAISRLSSGERQRLGLARLLCNQPRVLLLDEPTANLDRENSARMERLLDAYREQHQAAILWVSHDPEQQQRVGSRHYRLHEGKLEAMEWS